MIQALKYLSSGKVKTVPRSLTCRRCIKSMVTPGGYEVTKCIYPTHGQRCGHCTRIRQKYLPVRLPCPAWSISSENPSICIEELPRRRTHTAGLRRARASVEKELEEDEASRAKVAAIVQEIAEKNRKPTE